MPVQPFWRAAKTERLRRDRAVSRHRVSGRRTLLFSQQPDLGRKPHQCFHQRSRHDQRRRADEGFRHSRQDVRLRSFPTPNTNVFKPVRLGNKAIALKLCKNVLIRDVTIVHGGHFAILVTGCEQPDGGQRDHGYNRDGIDIDCCRNTMVSNCASIRPVTTAFAPRAPTRSAKPASRKSHHRQLSGLRFCRRHADRRHHEASRRTRSHQVRHRIERRLPQLHHRQLHVSRLQRLALEEVDGGILENITINNISMMDVATVQSISRPANATARPASAPTSAA